MGYAPDWQNPHPRRGATLRTRSRRDFCQSWAAVVAVYAGEQGWREADRYVVGRLVEEDPALVEARRSSARTARQTVGSKGWDGFAIAVVLPARAPGDQ